MPGLKGRTSVNIISKSGLQSESHVDVTGEILGAIPFLPAVDQAPNPAPSADELAIQCALTWITNGGPEDRGNEDTGEGVTGNDRYLRALEVAVKVREFGV